MANFFPNGNDGIKNGNGKRERSDQEEDPEFMPLSKRINNIHLSPERILNASAISNGIFNNPNIHRPPVIPSTSSACNGMVYPAQMNNVPEYHPAPTPLVNPEVDPHSIQYRPSMSQQSNPHYYEANRTLFHLYIERQLRNNLDPHPNVYGRAPDVDSSNNALH